MNMQLQAEWQAESMNSKALCEAEAGGLQVQA